MLRTAGGAACREPRGNNISLNVYWQRPIAFDENGRAQRRPGGVVPELFWHQKLVRDILGIYHVGVVVHGVEYTFGNYHAPHSHQLGGAAGGVVAHTPAQAGPHNVVKQSVPMGITRMAEGQVAEIAMDLSLTDFVRQSYNRVENNCVDFAREFCCRLGVEVEFPTWCHRASTTAKLIGLGNKQSLSATGQLNGQRGEHLNMPVPSKVDDIDVLADRALEPRPCLLLSHKAHYCIGDTPVEDGKARADDGKATVMDAVPNDEANHLSLIPFGKVTPSRINHASVFECEVVSPSRWSRQVSKEKLHFQPGDSDIDDLASMLLKNISAVAENCANLPNNDEPNTLPQSQWGIRKRQLKRQCSLQETTNVIVDGLVKSSNIDAEGCWI